MPAWRTRVEPEVRVAELARSWVGAGLTACLLWLIGRLFAGWFDQLDLRVYRMGAHVLWSRGDLYGVVEPGSGLPFTYPPFAAALMGPLAWAPKLVAGVGVGVASCMALARIAHLCVTRVAVVPGLSARAATWLLAGMGMLSEPVWSTLWLGQVNLLLVWLVLEDLTGPRGRLSGVGVGIATAVKLVPGVFMLWAWLLGRRGTALRAAAVFLVVSVLTATVFWSDSARYWSGMFLSPGHVGGVPYQGNQALTGVAARALGTETPPGWVTLIAVAGLAGALALATWVGRRGDAPRSLVIAGFAGLLASPISWSHHWIWWLPACWLLVADTAARLPGARWLLVSGLVVFLVRPLWWPSPAHDAALHFGLPAQLATAAYPLWTLAFLGWTGWSAARQPAPPAGGRRSG